MLRETVQNLIRDLGQVLHAGIESARHNTSFSRSTQSFQKVANTVPALKPVADRLNNVIQASRAEAIQSGLDALISLRQLAANFSEIDPAKSLSGTIEKVPTELYELTTPTPNQLKTLLADDQALAGLSETVDLRLVDRLMKTAFSETNTTADQIAEKVLPLLGSAILTELRKSMKETSSEIVKMRCLVVMCRIDPEMGLEEIWKADPLRGELVCELICEDEEASPTLKKKASNWLRKKNHEDKMTSAMDDKNRLIQEQRQRLEPFYREVGKVVVGQRYLIDRILMGLLTDGHILLEGVPGLAKTLTVHTIAQALQLNFRRIQFTPDLLPADVVGTQIYSPRSGEFSIKKGPVFAQIILADEINRAPAKVQSALLEAMQEKQVTLGDTTFPLPKPFLVLATQNPVEQEGTYPLPEAQIDRFMLKVHLDYPNVNDELAILDRMGGIAPKLEVKPVLGPDEVLSLQQTVDSIYVDEKLKRYIVDLVQATRRPKDYGLELSGMIQYGASPRATIALIRAGRAQAFFEGRGYVTPQDIKTVALDCLRHRLIISYEAEAEDLRADDILRRILNHLPIP